MRLPSIDHVISTAGHAARRFPFVLTCAFVAAGSGMLLIDSGVDEDLLGRFLYVSTLGLPLFVGIALLAQRRKWSGAPLLLVRLAGVLLLVALFFMRPAWSDSVAFLRYVQLSLGFHLLAAFSPYLGVGELNGFWQYNRTLLLRALTTAVFAVVLFAGLAGALAAVDNLLGINVDEVTYGRLWFFIAFVFSTWFFLGGVPENFAELEASTDYPAIIKVFSQFILTPIVAVYLVILTIYLGKIIVTRVWPSGWIGYLVSSVAALGILSLLLVHPIEEREENRWIRTYGRWFYVALVPSIVMLLLAIWKRIDQYGITEKRYFLVVLSLWLAGIALYFIFRRARNIKVIPITLCLVAFVTFAGPWGAFAVSRRSQAGRLERLLAANEMLVDGQARPAQSALSFEDRREMSAVVRYLAETHGTAALDPLFGDRLARIDTLAPGLDSSGRGSSDVRAELILGSLDVEYVSRWAADNEDAFSFLARPEGDIISVAGLDFGLRDWGADPDSVEIDGRSYVFELDEERSTVAMRRAGELLIEVPLGPVIRRALEYRRTAAGAANVPQDIFHVSAENESVRISVYVRSMNGTVETPGAAGTAADSVRYRITSFSADYYWSESAEAPSE